MVDLLKFIDLSGIFFEEEYALVLLFLLVFLLLLLFDFVLVDFEAKIGVGPCER